MIKYQPPLRDPAKGTVFVVSRDGRIPLKWEKLLDPAVNRCGVTPAESVLWSEVSLRLMLTSRQMSRELLLRAGRFRARVVYLPHEAEWLAATIAETVDAGHDVALWADR